MSEKKKLDALTALRFFAAAMVVLTHAHPIFGSFGIADAAPLGQGVSFFFVLSGFILTYNYPTFESARAVRKFLVARFARIWPLHAITCMLWIFLIFGFQRRVYFAGMEGIVKLAANLILVQSWIPLKDWALSFNGVSWSLSVEFFFYLVFPFIIIYWQKFWHYLCFAMILCIVCLLAIANHLRLPAGDGYAGVGLLGLIYFEPLVRVFEFTVGIGLAHAIRRLYLVDWTPAQWFVIEIGAIGGVVVALLAVAVPSGISNTLGDATAYYFQRDGLWLFWAFLIGTFALSTGPAAKFLSTKPLVFLGEISFALYLIHAIIMQFLDPYADRVKMTGVAGYAGFWAACLTFSTLLYFGIERPFRGLVLNWWEDRQSAGARTRKTPFGTLEQGSLASLLLVTVCVYLFQPTTVFPIDTAAVNAFMADPATIHNAGGAFSNGIRVVGIRVQEQHDGTMVASMLLKSDVSATLDSRVVVHLNDAQGAIIAQPADFPLDKAVAKVPAGTYWIQSFAISKADYEKSASIGIAMYRDLPHLLRVSGGRTDWQDRRLIVPARAT